MNFRYSSVKSLGLKPSGPGLYRNKKKLEEINIVVKCQTFHHYHHSPIFIVSSMSTPLHSQIPWSHSQSSFPTFSHYHHSPTFIVPPISTPLHSQIPWSHSPSSFPTFSHYHHSPTFIVSPMSTPLHSQIPWSHGPS